MVSRTGYRFDAAILCFTIFITVCQCGYSQQQAGDACILPSTNKTGQCVLLSECPKAIEDLQRHKIFPETCGFQGTLPIVCCVEKTFVESPLVNNRFSLIKENKSKEKCKQYSEEYNKNISKVQSVSPITGELVSYVQESCTHMNGFLIESDRALPKHFPHMAAIGYEDDQNNKSWLCSGVVISEKFVLTSAHCLNSRSHGNPKYIRVGDIDLDSDDDDAEPQEFNVAEIFRHPQFNLPSAYNDIGLLQLEKTVKFTSYVKPACLYTNFTLPSENGIVNSWNDFDTSSYLLKETVTFLPHAKCNNSFKDMRRRLKKGIADETQICANRNYGKDICLGGTGALVTYNKEEHCMYNVVGISSFGGSCAFNGIPEVFTRVSAYIPWIEGIVWPS